MSYFSVTFKVASTFLCSLIFILWVPNVFNELSIAIWNKPFFDEIIEFATRKAESLVNKYPNEESYQKEYDFLYSRVNIDSNAVHTEGDADVTY